MTSGNGPYPGIPLTQLPIKASPSQSAYAVIADAGAFLTPDMAFGGDSCSCITDATIITPVFITDYAVIVRSGVVYLATVSDVINAGSATPTVYSLNFSKAVNSMYVGVL